MKQLNCRNCGAPHNGKCDYCGTNYDSTIVPKELLKKPSKLTMATIIALHIIVPGLFLVKKIK